MRWSSVGTSRSRDERSTPSNGRSPRPCARCSRATFRRVGARVPGSAVGRRSRISERGADRDAPRLRHVRLPQCRRSSATREWAAVMRSDRENITVRSLSTSPAHAVLPSATDRHAGYQGSSPTDHLECRSRAAATATAEGRHATRVCPHRRAPPSTCISPRPASSTGLAPASWPAPGLPRVEATAPGRLRWSGCAPATHRRCATRSIRWSCATGSRHTDGGQDPWTDRRHAGPGPPEQYACDTTDA